VHNGAIKRRLDLSSYWLEFRLISIKNGEVPLTTSDGRSLSTAEFVELLSGDANDDVIMSVELSTDFEDAWDSSWGCVKVSFSAEDLRVGRETEYKGAITQYFHLEGAEIQLHREVMRPKIDPSILDKFEGTAKSNVVTAEQLHSKAAARKRKREAAAAARATQAAAATAATPDTAATTQAAAAAAATAATPNTAATTQAAASGEQVDIDGILD
jgi:hypothetical protein